MSFLQKIFGDSNQKYLKKIQPLVDQINKLEPKFERFSDGELKGQTQEFKARLKKGESLDDILPEAFAVVRESAKRTLGQRHYDVQLMGGIVLHQGKIAEMKTGEGKTLAATLALYLNALEGKGAHLVTVNDYLARRDTVWMGQIYYLLGLSVGCIAHEAAYLYDPTYQIENQKPETKNRSDELKFEDGERDKERDLVGGFRVIESYLRPVPRKYAYDADITYGTNNQFGFDYLRDNMAYDLSQMVQERKTDAGDSAKNIYHYAILDEVDSILIDEARTPLIISAPDVESSKRYKEFAQIIPRLDPKIDYQVDEEQRTVTLSEEGVNKVESILGVENIYAQRGAEYLHHLEQALRAQAKNSSTGQPLFVKDKDYVVRNGQVVIVDEFTGRLMPGRRWSGGLHQAIEAKEGLEIKPESKTLASITFQNYFRMYDKLAGMTGTAATSAEEFHTVYGLDVIVVPTNRPLIRKELPDRIYKSELGKFKAVVAEIKKRHQNGQPVLVGTRSIDKNEFLGRLLEIEGIPCQILNAKHHEKEGQIIAQAGRMGAVTVATNMAGRGVDIILGGNPFNKERAEKVKQKGGLYVLGTERHEARRIDNQLRGRTGRQGDPGSSQFFISLEDELMRIFGGQRIKALMERLRVPEDQPIEAHLVSKAVESAQAKVEGRNFDIRKHLLEYDDVLNKHREIIYKKRREFLWSANLKPLILDMVKSQIRIIVDSHCSQRGAHECDFEGIFKQIQTIFSLKRQAYDSLKDAVEKANSFGSLSRQFVEGLFKYAKDAYEKKEQELGQSTIQDIGRGLSLRTLDFLWMGHLDNMEYLRDSVNLRAYGQMDPLVEYKNEGHKMFQQLLNQIESNIVYTIFKVQPVVTPQPWLYNPSEIKLRPAGQPLSMSTEPVARRIQSKPVSSQLGKRKVGRNDPCPCGSGKKYKNCCWPKYGR